MFVDIAFMFVFLMSYDTVGMIKQFPERIHCNALSFLGDVVYIGGYARIVQWNIVTDSVLRLEGYPGLNLLHFDRA